MPMKPEDVTPENLAFIYEGARDTRADPASPDYDPDAASDARLKRALDPERIKRLAELFGWDEPGAAEPPRPTRPE